MKADVHRLVQLSGTSVLVAITVMAVTVLGLTAWSSMRWDATLRDSVVPLDRLAQSRAYALQSELFSERLLQGAPGTSPELVLAHLERALHAGHAIVGRDVRLGRLVMERTPPPALEAAVADYLAVLDEMAGLMRARIRRAESGGVLDLRILHARLRDASLAVERVLLNDMNARYRFQRELDRLVGLLLAAMMVAVIALRYRAAAWQRAAVARVIDSEARLRAFAFAMPDAAFMLDERATFLEVFGADQAVAAEGRERLLGRTVFEQFPREDALRFAAAVRQALAERRVQHLEYALQIGGSTRWFEARVAPVGELAQVVWVSRDVTDRREADERIRLNSVALEGTRDGVMVTDLKGVILSVNRAFTDITGYAEATVLGRTPSLLKSGRHDTSFYRMLWSALINEGFWQGEIWNRRANGEIAPHWMSISAVGGQSGVATHYVAVFTDISQIRAFEERVSHLSHYDALTGLPNRALMTSRLDHAVALARREGELVAVLLIDLDRFKNVNDALGHEHGDALIAAVAERFRRHLRHEDALGRQGGDEFLVLLAPLRDPAEAATVARDLLAALEQPFELQGQSLYIKASIGISLFPGDADNAANLLQQADTAMYEAKHQGRNTFRYYQESLTQLANTRLALESRLRRALDESLFELHFQPLVLVDGGAVIGAEALVRLRRDEGPPIGPAEFIPVMEESGMIVELGRWVQREVCRQGRSWLDAGLDFEVLALNLSPEEVRRGGVADYLREVLAETGFPPAKLELEITEGGLMERGEAAVAFLHELKALGLRLAIDDFGTGYSSLAYLKRFPVNKLKIDRSFIADIPHDASDVQLTATIVELARGLGLRVLAEGVETEAQRAFLAACGCDVFQGYLCSPPLPPEQFRERFLTRALQRG